MNYNLTPKARALLDTGFAKAHHALIEQEFTELAFSTALAEYVEQLAKDSRQEPQAKYWKIAGAHEFLAILRNLAEKPDVPKQTDTVNLGQH